MSFQSTSSTILERVQRTVIQGCCRALVDEPRLDVGRQASRQWDPVLTVVVTHVSVHDDGRLSLLMGPVQELVGWLQSHRSPSSPIQSKLDLFASNVDLYGLFLTRYFTRPLFNRLSPLILQPVDGVIHNYRHSGQPLVLADVLEAVTLKTLTDHPFWTDGAARFLRESGHSFDGLSLFGHSSSRLEMMNWVEQSQSSPTLVNDRRRLEDEILSVVEQVGRMARRSARVFVYDQLLSVLERGRPLVLSLTESDPLSPHSDSDNKTATEWGEWDSFRVWQQSSLLDEIGRLCQTTIADQPGSGSSIDWTSVRLLKTHLQVLGRCQPNDDLEPLTDPTLANVVRLFRSFIARQKAGGEPLGLAEYLVSVEDKIKTLVSQWRQLNKQITFARRLQRLDRLCYSLTSLSVCLTDVHVTLSHASVGAAERFGRVRSLLSQMTSFLSSDSSSKTTSSLQSLDEQHIHLRRLIEIEVAKLAVIRVGWLTVSLHDCLQAKPSPTYRPRDLFVLVNRCIALFQSQTGEDNSDRLTITTEDDNDNKVPLSTRLHDLNVCFQDTLVAVRACRQDAQTSTSSDWPIGSLSNRLSPVLDLLAAKFRPCPHPDLSSLSLMWKFSTDYVVYVRKLQSFGKRIQCRLLPEPVSSFLWTLSPTDSTEGLRRLLSLSWAVHFTIPLIQSLSTLTR